jgi:hypothetical protein
VYADADLFDDDLEAVADRLNAIVQAAGRMRARDTVASLDERRAGY